MNRARWCGVILCLWACEPARPAPEVVVERLEGDPVAADAPVSDELEHVSCYASDEREGALMCVLDPTTRDGSYIPRQILAGDRRTLFAFERRKKLCCQAPDPPDSTFVTFHDASGYVRLQKGWAAVEGARQKGLVDTTDRSTGEFFTSGRDRKLDRGQAPALMRSRDGAVAALRCADTLHRFSALSPADTRDVFASARVMWTREPRWDLGADATRRGDESLTLAQRSVGPCSQLFGLPSSALDEVAEKEQGLKRSLRAPTLPDVRWCIDRKGEEPWLDVSARDRVRERMGAEVTRDVTELARRLHGLEPVGDWDLTFEPARLRRVQAWWASLKYGAPRPAARLEVVNRFGTRTPRNVRLEHHTEAGERFAVTFEHCAKPRFLGQIGAKTTDSGQSLVDRLTGGAGKTSMDDAFANSTGRRERAPWFDEVHERGHCFELTKRQGVYACVVHQHEVDGKIVSGELFLGDTIAMRRFHEQRPMGGLSPSPRLDATLEPHGHSDGYLRYPRGARAREKARRKGLVDRTDHSTGEFFTRATERVYDQGQAPLFMRRQGEAALRCGDTLHRFRALSPKRAQKLLGDTRLVHRRDDVPSRMGVALAPDEPSAGDRGPTSRRRRRRSSIGPCTFLFGPPSEEQARRGEELKRKRKATFEVEVLPAIEWCLDLEGTQDGLDHEAKTLAEERMGARVARDTAALARRLRAIEPDIEPGIYGPVTYPVSDLKRIHRWWKGLDYPNRPEAVRLELMGRRSLPRYVQLENHTNTGARFATLFGWCESRPGSFY